MKVLVTGGAGFIGRWVVKRLLEGDHIVYVLDNLSNGSIENLEEFDSGNLKDVIVGDIKDRKGISRLFKKVEFDIIIHLAANVVVQDSIDKPRKVFESDVIGTFNLLEEARKHNIKFVFVSSCMVYDTAIAYGAISETHPTKAASPYAATKLANESLVQAYHISYNLPTVILRPFNTYGQYQKTTGEGGVVSIFIKQDITGGTLKIYGDGMQTRDLMHVEDCAEFIVDAALDPCAVGEIINGGYGEDISINRLAALICKDSFNRIKHVNHIHPQSEIPKLRCDRSKAKRLLGWEPRISLEEGIKQTRDFICSKPEKTR